MMAWKDSKQLIIKRKQLVAKFVEEASLVGYLVPRDVTIYGTPKYV